MMQYIISTVLHFSFSLPLSISLFFISMASIASAFQHALASVAENAKLRDMERNKVIPTSKIGMTTDFGAAVSDTDNW